jgi:hypothetical protein
VKRLALVGVATALTDGFWTIYIKQVAAHHLLLAALASSAIVLLGGFITVSYIDDRRSIYAAVLGAFIGTAISMSL